MKNILRIIIPIIAIDCVSGNVFCSEKSMKKETTKLYIESDKPPRKIAGAKFDKIRMGMSLRAIVAILGPGHMSFTQHNGGKIFPGSTGTIPWHCEDGRILYIWPSTYKLDEKTVSNGNEGARMWMEKLGKDGQTVKIEIPNKS